MSGELLRKLFRILLVFHSEKDIKPYRSYSDIENFSPKTISWCGRRFSEICLKESKKTCIRWEENNSDDIVEVHNDTLMVYSIIYLKKEIISRNKNDYSFFCNSLNFILLILTIWLIQNICANKDKNST